MILQIHVQRTWRASAHLLPVIQRTHVVSQTSIRQRSTSTTRFLQKQRAPLLICRTSTAPGWRRSRASVSDLHSKPNLKLESVLIDYDSFRTKLRNSNPSVTWHRNIKSMWEPNCWTTIPDLVLHVPYRYRRMRGDRRRANRTCDQMLISCLVKFVSCDNRTSLIHQIKDTWNNIKLTMFSDRSEWTKEQRNRSRKTGNSGNSSQENNNNNLQLTEPTFRPLLSLCSEVNLWQMWTPLLKHAEGLQAEADQHGSLNWTWTSATTSCLTDWRGNIKTFTRSNHQIKC